MQQFREATTTIIDSARRDSGGPFSYDVRTMPNKRIRVRTYRLAGRKNFTAEWTDPSTGRKRTRSTGTNIKRDVERFRVRLEDELNDPHASNDPRTTWSDFVDRVEADFLPSKRPSTRVRYRSTISVIEQRMNPRLLSGIRADEIAKFKTACRKAGNREETVAANLRHLKSLLRWAVDQGMLAKCPKISIPSSAEAKGRYLTEGEFDATIEAIPEVVGEDRAESWRHLVRGLRLSGLRISEAVNLTWNDRDSLHVDLAAGMLVIPGAMQKGKRNTITPLVPGFAEFLGKTPKPDRRGFVFNPEAGRGVGRMQQRQIQFVFAKIAKAAGVKATLHDLRRSFCHEWAKVLLPQHLKQLARHRSIQTTLQFYAGIEAADTAEAIRRALANTTAKTTDTGDSGDRSI